MKGKLFLTILVLSIIIQATPALSADINQTEESQLSILSNIIASLEKILDSFQKTLSTESGTTNIAAVAVAVPSTDVGGRAQLKAAATVYQYPRGTSKSLGTQPAGAIGSVNAGPQNETTYTYTPAGCNLYQAAVYNCIKRTITTPWMMVNFDSGADGWVQQSNLTPAVSAKFTVGAPTVIKTDQTNIRNAPNGTIMGNQQKGKVGVIKGAPVSAGGYVWWPVDYRSGTDGWTVESNILNPGIPLSFSPEVNVMTTMPQTSSDMFTASSKMAIDSTVLQNAIKTMQYENVAISTANDLSIVELPFGTVVAYAERPDGSVAITAAGPDGTEVKYIYNSNNDKIGVELRNKSTQALVGEIGVLVDDVGVPYVTVTTETTPGIKETQIIEVDKKVIDSVMVEVFRDVPLPDWQDRSTVTFGTTLTNSYNGMIFNSGFGNTVLSDGCSLVSCGIGGSYDFNYWGGTGGASLIEMYLR